jgi:hypothetical protein
MSRWRVRGWGMLLAAWVLTWTGAAQAQDGGAAMYADRDAGVAEVPWEDGAAGAPGLVGQPHDGRAPLGSPDTGGERGPAGEPDTGDDPGTAGEAGRAGEPETLEETPDDATSTRDRTPPVSEPEGDRVTGDPATGTAATETPAAPRDEGGLPGIAAVPAPPAADAPEAIADRLHELIPVLPASRTGSSFGLLIGILLALLGTSLARRVREALPPQGLIPRVMQAVHTLLRLLVLGLAVALLVGLLPAWMGPTLPWILLAAAAALGWSARDLLPDLVAGVVILFERRVRRGVWLSGEGFSGTVSGVGLRATLLMDAHGHRIAVPNRRLLSGPIATDPAVGAEHEVTLRMEPPWAAPRVRQALVDAVLQSPWVPPGAAPVVLRDPDRPHVWRVRSRLLEARYAPRFEGELLERTEALLAAGSSPTFPLDEELDDA